MIDGENAIEIDGSLSSPGPGLTIAGLNEDVFGAGIRRITVSGFRGDGILIDATHGFVVLNPVIDHSTITANAGAGIRTRGNVPFVHIGTFSSGNRLVENTISSNGSHGIHLESGFFELEANVIRSNSGSGVFVENPAFAHLERNTITLNRQAGLSTVSPNPTAFKGAIGNSIHSNVGPAIELRDGQTPPEITSATYDIVTGVGTITGFFTRVASPGGWTTVLDFAMSAFPEVGGRGVLEAPISVNTTFKDEGNGRFSFRGTTTITDTRGKRISATATPFIFEGFKGPPTGDVFGQGFVYGTTSEASKAIPVIMKACGADLPQLRAATVVGTNVTLIWSAVSGATGYNVWLRSVPGIPTIVASTIGGTTATISVAPGQYESFFEATFPGCPSMKSEAVSLGVVPGRQRAVGR